METQASLASDAARILVVEDDAPLRSAVVEALKRQGFETSWVDDGAAAIRALEHATFDVILLDIGLPFIDGWKILDRLDGHRSPSVVIISARGDEQDKVRALNMGADDYLAKPFGSEELIARIRAVLRRARPAAESSEVVHCGSVSVDFGRCTAFKDGAEVRLSPTEYALLSELARHAGQVIDHRTLLRRVWGPMYGDERNYLRTFVQRLRVKLEHDSAHPEVIVTVGLRGYRFGPAASG